jgi:hypothetical protein
MLATLSISLQAAVSSKHFQYSGSYNNEIAKITVKPSDTPLEFSTTILIKLNGAYRHHATIKPSSNASCLEPKHRALHAD